MDRFDTSATPRWPTWPIRLLRALYLLLAVQIGQSAAMEAAADITDKPRFYVPGLVFIWTGDGRALSGETVRVRQDQAIGATADTHNIAGSSFATGFQIASNAPFNIDAALAVGTDVAALNQIEVRFSITVDGSSTAGFGAQAQHPHSQGQGFIKPAARLSEFQTRQTLFRGDRRTAARPGTIASQSIRFNALYHAPTATETELAAISAQMIYTVYIP